MDSAAPPQLHSSEPAVGPGQVTGTSRGAPGGSGGGTSGGRVQQSVWTASGLSAAVPSGWGAVRPRGAASREPRLYQPES